MEKTLMIKKIEKFREYLSYVENHYNNVQEAWKLLNERIKPINPKWYWDDAYWHVIDTLVKRHDLSKLSAEEFTQYRKYFFPAEGEGQSKKDFDSAWEHHKEHNLHHWQSWTASEGREVVVYIVEMCLDWIAMSMQFGDTALEYYESNKEKMGFSENEEGVVYELLNAYYDKKWEK